MSLPGELLAQAEHLARLEPRRPRQASLRRSVSAAYYALFHLLVGEAVHALLRGRRRGALRVALTRVFLHQEMQEAARGFATGHLGTRLRRMVPDGAVTPALRTVAEAFVALQEARHDADYDVARTFTRRECRDFVEQAREAFSAWRGVRGTIPGDAFLVALLAHRRLRG